MVNRKPSGRERRAEPERTKVDGRKLSSQPKAMGDSYQRKRYHRANLVVTQTIDLGAGKKFNFLPTWLKCPHSLLLLPFSVDEC